ncbi:MAG: phosphate ABC transporter permease PstA [Chloroflexota bacterium]
MAQATTFGSVAIGSAEHKQILLNAEEIRFVRRKATGRLVATMLAVLTGLAVAILFIIIGYIVANGVGGINPAFFTEIPKPMGRDGGGIAQAIVGSFEMLIVGSLIAIPFGLLTAIYLAEFGKGRLAGMVRFAVELLASLPSIVIGVFVWALIVRTITGFSGWAGAIALAVIMIPIMARSVEEILRLVPNSLREAAMALGVPRWRVTMQVVVPSVLPGILTGIVLAIARAAGETAPLLLTSLGNQFFNYDMGKPMAAIPLQIYNYAIAPSPDWHTKSWAATMVLVIVVALFSAAVRFSMRKFRYAR